MTGDQVFLKIHFNPGSTRKGEELRDGLRGESDGSQPKDRITDDSDARNGLKSIEGISIIVPKRKVICQLDCQRTDNSKKLYKNLDGRTYRIGNACSIMKEVLFLSENVDDFKMAARSRKWYRWQDIDGKTRLYWRTHVRMCIWLRHSCHSAQMSTVSVTRH